MIFLKNDNYIKAHIARQKTKTECSSNKTIYFQNIFLILLAGKYFPKGKH